MGNCDPLVKLELEARRAEGTWSEVAAHLGVSRAYLSDIIRGNRQPGERVLAQLGLKRVVTHAVSYHKRYGSAESGADPAADDDSP